jgi:adenine deaminase
MRALSQCCPSRSDSGDAELTVHEVAAMTHTSEVSTGTELALMMQVRDGLPLCWEALDTAMLTPAAQRTFGVPG